LKKKGANRGVVPNYQLGRENYLLSFLKENNEILVKKINFNKMGSLLIFKEKYFFNYLRHN